MHGFSSACQDDLDRSWMPKPVHMRREGARRTTTGTNPRAAACRTTGDEPARSGESATGGERRSVMRGERSARLLGGLAALLVLALLTFGVAFAGWRDVTEFLADLPANLNPEDASHFNPVALVNDTGASVEVALCGNTCDDTYGFSTLDPGDEQPQQVSNEDLPTSFLVRRADHPARCLTITLTEPRAQTVRVALSTARPCGDLLADD
jgi:hypothetical protein